MSFYFGDTDFRVGDYVNIITYDSKEYIGIIKDIGEYDDHYHSAPVMSLFIKINNDYVEIEDWKIIKMSYISKHNNKRTIKQLFADCSGDYVPEELDWGEDVGEEIIEDENQ